MRGLAKIAVFLVLALSCVPPLLPNNAFSHGNAPSTCENRYDATIASMAIDNGTQTSDPANLGLEFDAQIGAGYDVALTLHTANVNSQNNTSAGDTWYRNTAFGFGSGACVDNAGPDQDVQVSLHVEAPSGVPDGYVQNAVEWGSWPEVVQITYKVVWHDATDPGPPEEQPTQQEYDPEPAPDDDESEGDQELDDDDFVGTLVSPFDFRNETSAVPASEIEEQMPQIANALEINGTLASFHYLNGIQLCILSGNWSMAMNDTSVIGFGANFTMARANGLGRQTLSLDNMTAVSDSDLGLSNGDIALTSALDLHHANGTITKENVTITVERLNVVKIELGSASPIYGVVNKVIRIENGETLVMARQFDMI